MGWTTTHKPKGTTASEYIIDNCLTWSDDCTATYTVLDSAVVKFRTFYAAMERIDKVTGEREVWAAVYLLSHRPKAEHNFGWKDMDETCGPCEAECPERILDLLTPTENQYANDWRARCREHIAKRKARPKVEVGTKLRLYDKDYIVTEKLGRRGFGACGLTVPGHYRLTLSQLDRCTILEGV